MKRTFLETKQIHNARQDLFDSIKKFRKAALKCQKTSFVLGLTKNYTKNFELLREIIKESKNLKNLSDLKRLDQLTNFLNTYYINR